MALQVESRGLQDFVAIADRQGFRPAASMELDLRVRADGGFVVMLDDTLDRKTDDSGPAIGRTAAELAGVRCRQSRRPLIVPEHLAKLMSSAHPSALLQFDMKDDLARIGARGLDHLTDLFGSSANPIIFSGACLDLIGAPGDRLAHLPRGIDPTCWLKSPKPTALPRPTPRRLASCRAGLRQIPVI